MTDDLVTWLRATMDAIESDARSYLELQPDSPDWASLVLSDVEAKRQILELHRPDRILENWYWLQRACAECGKKWHRWIPDRLPTDIGPEVGCPTVRLLALPYADEPSYREEWRP